MSPWLYLFFCYFIKVYQDSWLPAPLALKGKGKFEFLLVKIFILKQKTNTSSYYRKIEILSLQKNSVIFLQTIHFVEIVTTRSSRQGIKKETSNTKALQADLGIFTHLYSGRFRYNQAYSGIIQAHLELRVNLTYSESWQTENQKQIQNLGIFRTLAYSDLEAYLEPRHTENLGHIQNPVKHLRWSVLQK